MGFRKSILIISAIVFQLCFMSFSDAASDEAKTNYGNTPLHNAAGCSHLDVIELLLNRGANIKAKNPLGFTPAGWASFNHHENASKFLRSKENTSSNVSEKQKRERVENLFSPVKQELITAISRDYDLGRKDQRKAKKILSKLDLNKKMLLSVLHTKHEAAKQESSEKYAQAEKEISRKYEKDKMYITKKHELIERKLKKKLAKQTLKKKYHTVALKLKEESRKYTNRVTRRTEQYEEEKRQLKQKFLPWIDLKQIEHEMKNTCPSQPILEIVDLRETYYKLNFTYFKGLNTFSSFTTLRSVAKEYFHIKE